MRTAKNKSRPPDSFLSLDQKSDVKIGNGNENDQNQKDPIPPTVKDIGYDQQKDVLNVSRSFSNGKKITKPPRQRERSK